MYLEQLCTLKDSQHYLKQNSSLNTRQMCTVNQYKTALSSWYSKEVRNGFCIPVCTVSNSISCASKVETNLCLELV